MARNPKETVDFFPFICSEGQTSYFIEEKYGNDGFATWIKLLRQLAKTPKHFIRLNERKTVRFLSALCKVSENKFISIVNDLVDFEEFDRDLMVDHKIIWSPRFIKEIEFAYENRVNDVLSKKDLIAYITNNKTELNPKKPKRNTHIIQDDIIEEEIKIDPFSDLKLLASRIGKTQFQVMDRMLKEKPERFPQDNFKREIIVQWLGHKWKKKQSYQAEQGIILTINKLNKHTKEEIIAGLTRSIENNYAGLFINKIAKKNVKKDKRNSYQGEYEEKQLQ